MKFLPKALLVAGALALPGLASAQELHHLKIGTAALSGGVLPIIVAGQQGLFKEQGLDYERIDFAGGGPAAQGLASGSVDFCMCAAEHAIRLTENGLGGKILLTLADHHSYALLGPKDSKAESLKDLKGEKIGITSAGSLTDTTIRYQMKKDGLNPDTDAQLIATGGTGPSQAAVKAGAVSAAMFTTPAIQVTLATGDFKIVEDFRKLAYPAHALVATVPWLEKNPEVAKEVQTAVIEALRLIHKDPSVLKPAIKELYPEIKDEALIDKIAQDCVNGYLSETGEMTDESYDVLKGMVEISAPGSSVPSKDDLLAPLPDVPMQ